ncbi:hypothetical protein FRC01_008430 [Tulasnella sp. 417]|nr:hypothetical protein FRC01_008430 [Tulasnella sp. 417]
MPVSFKFVLPQEGVTRKVTFTSKPKWHEIATKVESLFRGYSIAANEVAVSYIDSDNDSITISTGEELRDFYEQEAKALASGAIFKFFVKRLPRPGAGSRNRLSDIIPQVDEDPMGPNSPDSGMLGGHGWDEVEHDSLPDTPMGIPVYPAPGGIGIQPLMHSMFNYIPSEPNRGRASPAISEARIEEVPSRTGSAGIEEPLGRASRAYSPSPIPTRVPPSKAKKGKEKVAEKLPEKLPDKLPERKDRDRGKPKGKNAPIVIDLPRDGNRPFSLNTPDSPPTPQRSIPQVPFSRRETGPTVVDTPTSDEEFDVPSPPSPKPTRHRRQSAPSAPPSIYNDIAEVMSKLSVVMMRASDGTYVRNQHGVVDPASAEAAMESARAAIEDTAKAVGSSLNSVLSQLSAHIPQQRQTRNKKSEMPFFGSAPSQPRHREPPQPQPQPQPQPRPNSFYAYDPSGRDANRPPYAPPPQMVPPPVHMAPPPVQMHSRPNESAPPPFVPYGAFQQPVVVPAPGPPPVGSFFGGPPPNIQRSTSTRPQYDQPVFGGYPAPQGPLPQTRPTFDPQAAEQQPHRGVANSPSPFRASANLPSSAEKERLEAAKQLYKMEKATFRAQREAERREREERRALRQKGNPEYGYLAHSLEAVFAAHQAQEMQQRDSEEEEEEEIIEPPRPVRPAEVPSFFEPPTSGRPDPPSSSEDEGPIHVFPAESSKPSKHRGPYHERSERLMDKLDAMGFSASAHPSVPQVVKEESKKNLSMPDEEMVQRIIERVLETEEPSTPAPQGGPSKGASNKTTGQGKRRGGKK